MMKQTLVNNLGDRTRSGHEDGISSEGDAVVPIGTATGSLGGYSKIFPVTDPATGKVVHLVGMEETVQNADRSVVWPQSNVSQKNVFYSGAVYGVRRGTAAGDYTTGEVNGYYKKGDPVLEAPRAFAMSPFKGEENVVYIGGFDTNFHNATNMAWIFKAGATTIISGDAAHLKQ